MNFKFNGFYIIDTFTEIKKIHSNMTSFVHHT